MSIIISIIIFIALIGLYVLPTVLAFHRGHNNRTSLMIINLLLGWSGLFWVLSLAWVFYNPPAAAPAKKTTASKAKKEKSTGLVVVGLLLFLIVALLGINLLVGAGLSLEAPSVLDTANQTQSGVPMSADDFLRGQ